jgi:pimeloyl-ACP methyl ester carboxylesterase
MPPRLLDVHIAGGAVSMLHWRSGAQARRAPIHFAHANGFNAQTYESLLAPLAHERDVYAWDARGHGRTDLPADPAKHHSWRVYVADLIATLEALRCGPFVLGGHSMGATVSLVVAAQRPDLVRGLVLAEPVILPERVRLLAKAAKILGFYDRIMPMAAQASNRRKTWPNVQAAFESYRGRGAFKTWPDRMLQDYLDGGLTPVAGGDEVTLACKPEWEAANYRAGPVSVWSSVAKLPIPVVLLTGGRRSTCPESVSRALVAKAKNMKWQHFPECSHFLPMEQPGSVADSLQAMDEYAMNARISPH